MRPAEFWCSTLPEIAAFLEGSRLAQRDAHDIAIVGAWYAGLCARAEKMPDLKDLLRESKRGKRTELKTKEEVIESWKGLFRRMRPA